jgi:hypothetical protein
MWKWRCCNCGAASPPVVTGTNKGKAMSLGTVLLVILILMLLGVLPVWPHARSWGYGPSGIVGVILVIIIVLLVLGRL